MLYYHMQYETYSGKNREDCILIAYIYSKFLLHPSRLLHQHPEELISFLITRISMIKEKI